MIHVGVVKRDEVRPLRWRQTQPRKNLLYALLVRKFIIVGQVIAGAFSLNFGFRARPEKTSRSHSLHFRELPKWRASVPTPVDSCLWIRDGIFFFSRWVVKRIGDNPMMVGIEPGHNRVVIGKGQGRKHRKHTF